MLRRGINLDRTSSSSKFHPLPSHLECASHYVHVLPLASYSKYHRIIDVPNHLPYRGVSIDARSGKTQAESFNIQT